MVDLISINEAAARGIARVRKPRWAAPEDHLKIDIVNGKPGPWLHLFAPFNKEYNGRDPVDLFAYQCDLSFREYEPYIGPLPDSVEYKAKVASYGVCLMKSDANA